MGKTSKRKKVSDTLPPKPPETLQKIKWFLLYGSRHKKIIAIGILIFILVWCTKNYIVKQSGSESPPPIPSTWDSLFQPPKTLTVLTGLLSEELDIFRKVAVQFAESHERNFSVSVENATLNEILSKLKQKDADVDLITFDINGQRHQLVHEDLIEDLSKQKYIDLIPSSVNPVLLEHLEVKGTRYFTPFRPNVQVVFWNKKKFEFFKKHYDQLRYSKEGIPKTWTNVLIAANLFHNNEGEARVVIHAHEDVVHHTLFQFICSANGDPFNLNDPNTTKALRFLRILLPRISPKSSEVNGETASGFLQTNSVYLVRNWSLTANILKITGRTEEFGIHSGWIWKDGEKPFNLLGGELLAMPKDAPNKELAIEFMKFLMSKQIQEEFVNKLNGLPMRVDAIGGIKGWQKNHQIVMNEALQYARPLPEHWHPHMPEIYREMFAQLIKIENQSDETQLDNILGYYQKKIDKALIK